MSLGKESASARNAESFCQSKHVLDNNNKALLKQRDILILKLFNQQNDLLQEEEEEEEEDEDEEDEDEEEEEEEKQEK